jgi:hypothetical protein
MDSSNLVLIEEDFENARKLLEEEKIYPINVDLIA